MNKLFEQVKEKAMLGVIMAMLGIGGTFLYNVGATLWNLPDTVSKLDRLTREVDSIQRVNIKYLEQDNLDILNIQDDIKDIKQEIYKNHHHD